MKSQHVSYPTLHHFLGDAVKGLLPEGVFPPTLYFDTNVFLDLIDNRDRDSLTLCRYAWLHQWQCVTSIFAKVETLEVKQFHLFKSEKQKLGWSKESIEKGRHKRDLSPRILGNISRSLTARIKSRCEGFKQYSCLLEEGWTKAEEVKRKTNLTDKDSIHLAEALAIACDLFITQDKPFISVAKKYIWAECPNSVVKILKSVGAKI